MRQLPNALTLFRLIAGVILPVWMLAPPTPPWAILLALFIAAALTDGLDGFLARRYHWQSKLGAALDPLADKVLVLGTLTGLTIALPLGAIGAFAILLIAAREIIVTALRTHSPASMTVTYGAKLKTTLQLGACITLLASAALKSQFLFDAGFVFLLAAVPVTLWTGLAYIRALK